MGARVGVVGLGKMGLPIARRLIDAGYTVYGCNRSAASVDELVGHGGHRAASPADLAKKVSVVLSALPTEASVLAVYEEMASVAEAEQLFVDHSTVSLTVSAQCHRLLAERGAWFLDAPVSGGPGGAAAGTLTVMVGGAERAFDIGRPIFEAFGKVVRLCGPTGAGQAVKLVNQLLVGIQTAAASEAAAFGASLGAEPDVILEMLSTSFGSSAMLIRNLPRVISGDFSPATPIALIAKDLGIIRSEADRVGVELRLGPVADELFNEGIAADLGNEDMSAVIKMWGFPLNYSNAREATDV